jgi:hypothetical protein
MCPTERALEHPAAPLLSKRAQFGCPTKTGQPWTKEEIWEVVARGSHQLALSQEAIKHFAIKAEEKPLMIPPRRRHLRIQLTKLGKRYHTSYMSLQRHTKMHRFSWQSGTSKMGSGAWIAQREKNETLHTCCPKQKANQQNW